jgi:excisionase family DNA binding protein
MSDIETSRPAAGAPISPLLDVDAVAAALGVNRWTIYKWSRRGRIPSLSAGRKLRFQLGEVIEALRRAPLAQEPSESRATRSPRAGARSSPRDVGAGAASRPAAIERAAPTPTVDDPLDRIRAAVDATRALGQ